MTIRNRLHNIAALLLSMADDAEYWSDAMGYRQAARRVLRMARDWG
jgi:hypothetical protein